MDNTNLKEWALFYAQNGLAVFPLQTKSKIPYGGSKGCKDATTDLNTIEKWWTDRPQSNIGIATGFSGLVVIDIDTHKEGQDGFEVLDDWQRKNAELPETWQSLTGGGGSHLLFKTDREISNSTGLFNNGIDIRSEGGYIVAPPSIHESGKRYEWECEHDPEEIPLACANDLVYRFISEGKAEKGHGLDWDAEISRDSIDPDVGLTFCQGGRNDALFQRACDLFKSGSSQTVVYTAISALNNQQCKPPLSDKEITTIIQSALKNKTDKGEIPVPISDSDLELKTIDDFEEEEPEWLVPEYIPKGQITCLVGDGGVGKSTIWASIVADLSAGRLPFLNAGFGEPILTEKKKIMVLSGEDSIAYTVKRRLRKNGALCKNILCLDAGDSRFSKLKLNGDMLKRLVAKHRPDLLILDPIQSFLDEKTNMAFRNAIRANLQPLIMFGSQYGTTTILVVHTNKRTQVSGRQRMADSADLWDAARSVLLVGKTKEKGIRYISHEKSNYGKEGETALFTIENEVPKFQGYSDEKDRDFVSGYGGHTGSPVKDDAKDFILELLQSGAKTSSQIDEAGKAEEYSKRTLQRARKELSEQKKISSKTVSNGKGTGTTVLYSLPCQLSFTDR